jgi:heme exporter protein A
LSTLEAQAILDEVGLSRQQNLPARSLSAGQRRRVALARLLASKAAVWILDEVLTSLDDVAIKLSRRFIGEHLSEGGLAIIATHQKLDLVADRVQQIELSK